MKDLCEKKLIGLGFRPDYFSDLSGGHPFISWLELLTENYIDSTPSTLCHLQSLRDHYSMSFHGVSLSIGGIHPLDWEYLHKVKKLKNLLNPMIVSDHLSFSRFKSTNSHDLLPIVYTEESLHYVSQRVAEVQDFLGVRLYLENASAYLSFSANQIPEHEFIRLLCKSTGCGIILDINNLFVNQKNLNYNPEIYFKSLTKKDIGYCHLAGHSVTDKVRIDTHGSDICNEVWELLTSVTEYFGPIPTMIERDQNLPDFKSIENESQKIISIFGTNPQQKDSPPSLEHPDQGDWIFPRPNLTLKSSQDISWKSLAEIFFDSVMIDNSTSFERVKHLLDYSHPTPSQVGFDVYFQGFRERLFGVLADQTPIFTAAVGRTTLRKLLDMYIKRHPPDSYCVDKSVENFSIFLQDNIKNTEISSLIQSEIPLEAFFELAQFEQTLYHQIFQNGVPEEILSTDHLVKHLEKISWDELCLTEFKVLSSTKFLALNYDVVRTVTSYKKSGLTLIPAQKTTYVTIFKREGVTTPKKIPRWQYEFLTTLETKITLGNAFLRCQIKDPSKMTKYLHCLGYWCQMGIIADTISQESSAVVASKREHKDLFSPELAP